MTAGFTYRRARSGALVAGLAMALVVEALAFHLLLYRRHPVIAWTLTALSVWALWWIASDYRALGTGALVLDDHSLHVQVGRRAAAVLPRSVILGVTRPSWRDLPASARDYLNATKPAEPNVLIVLREPAPVRLLGAITRTVTRIGICVDDPERFVEAVGAAPPRA